MNQQFLIATGIRYSFNQEITAYNHLDARDADLDLDRGPLAGRLEGDYKSNDVHLFALNLSWRL